MNMHRLRPFPSRDRQAFTLIEIIVAIGVTVLMASFILAISNNVLRQWGRIAGRLNAEEQGVVALEQMAADLGSAVIKRDGRVWLAATIQPDQTGFGDSRGVSDIAEITGNTGRTLTYSRWSALGKGTMKPFGLTSPYTPNSKGSSLVIPSYLPPTTATQVLTTSTNINQPSGQPDLLSYRFGQAGVWLRMFVPTPDDNNGQPNDASGIYRAVSYQIVRMRQSATSQSYRYYLFRSVVRPFAPSVAQGAARVQAGANMQIRSTFGAGYDFFRVFQRTDLYPAGTHSANISIYNNPNATGGLLPEDAGNIRQPNISQVIANNVIDFGVRIWGRTTDTSGRPMDVMLFPASRSYNSNPNLGFAASTEDGFTRRDESGQLIPAIQPSQSNGTSYTGWNSTTAMMTYAFAYNPTGTPGPPPVNTGRPCTPVYADILLRILDDEGARKIEALENDTSSGAAAQAMPAGISLAGENWWRIAEEHSRVLTRRVQLLGVRPM
jgi:type II secretory pathway pseudopilin PulG